jgi:hypothetical protein
VLRRLDYRKLPPARLSPAYSFTNISQIPYDCGHAAAQYLAMNRITQATLAVFSLVLPLSAQSLTIPHVVDGAGWQSTIVLTNMSSNPASATLIFHKETTGGNTQPWNLLFKETTSTAGLSMAGGSSLFLHTAGTASDLSQGWGELNADAGVTGYVVFTIRVPGHQDQDGTAPVAASANRLLVPYDDSNGFVTGIAVVNPTGTPQDISVGFRTTTGGVATAMLPTVPAGGHMSFVLSQQFPVIQGHEGLAEFYSATGNFSMIALRVNPTSSFTAAPVYFQTGAPLIKADPAAPYDPSMPSDPGYPIYGYQVSRSGSGTH